MTARPPRTGPTGTGHGATPTDRVIRWAAAASVATVTAIAAVISYRHAYELVQRYGETGTIARVLPLTIDGLIATCSLVILDCVRRGRRPPWHAWALLTAGIAATLGANIAHGAHHGVIGSLVAGWPALVAVGCFELATRLLEGDRPARPTIEPGPAPPGTSAPTPEGERPAEPTAPTVGATGPETEDALVETAENQFGSMLRQGHLPSLRVLKKELKVGHARAARIQAILSDRLTESE